MGRNVTVSAKIDEELRKKLVELGISPSEVIRKALEKEVKEKTKALLYRKVEAASRIMSKVSREAWTRSVRETRDER